MNCPDRFEAIGRVLMFIVILAALGGLSTVLDFLR